MEIGVNSGGEIKCGRLHVYWKGGCVRYEDFSFCIFEIYFGPIEASIKSIVSRGD